ncbi:MAG: hypothetical protein JXB06_09940 [Spirochaetales bacterium]|nr:hypothetical protein [Spirochaetales bacterium]
MRRVKNRTIRSLSRVIRACLCMLACVLALEACQNQNAPPSDPPPAVPADLQVRQGSTIMPPGAGEYLFDEPVLIDGDGGYCCGYVGFTIENLGEENLLISEVALSGGDLQDFDLDTQSLAALLEPSYATFFSVRFDPLSGPGARSCSVTISSNDDDVPSYTISVAGAGMRKLVAADRTEDNQFGSAVSVCGDTAAVSCPRYADGSSWNQGAVYLFVRDHGGADAWGQLKKITAANSSGGYGGYVAIDGDTLVTSAGGQGVVYVYYRNQGGTDNWGEARQITVSDSTEFGGPVALDGDVLVVAQSGDDIGANENQGSAHVFYRNQGGADNWGQVRKLISADGAAFDCFGVSVAVHSDTIVVGAHGVDAFYSGQGAAYVFYRNQGGADNWGQAKRLTASDGAQSDFFGWSVDVEADIVAVGASQSPCAYVFERDRGGPDYWGEAKRLTAADTLMRSVTVCGDTVAACASNADSARGAVYLFSRDRGGTDNWGQVKRLAAGDGEQLDIFGCSVACSDETVLAGAIGDDGSRGSAYIYDFGALK